MAQQFDHLVRRTHLFWHVVFFSGALVGLYVVIDALKPVLTPVAAALVLSYLLDPAVSWFDRRLRWPRWLGCLIIFVGILMLGALVFLLVVPVLVREIQAFAEATPEYVQRVRVTLVPWVERTFSVTVPHTLGEMTSSFGDSLRGYAKEALGPLGGVANKVASGAADFLSTLVMLGLIPVFTFFFLPKYPQIRRRALRFIPRRYVSWVQETAIQIDAVLASWIRGQIMVIAVLAVLYSTGLIIIGIKMAVLIGMITGLLAFIPYVGVVVGMTLALIVTLLEYAGPGQLIGVTVVFVVVQVTDGLFLTPRIVGDRTGLGPVGVILALMVGGTLFGFVGVLLAVPTAAVLAVIARRGLDSYRESSFYLRSRSSEERAVP